MSPFFSQVPMGWMSEESTSLQKSLLLSLPSRRRRRRTPVSPITVAMHTDVELRGSWASSFIPTLKSLEGGILACRWRERNVESFPHEFRLPEDLLCGWFERATRDAQPGENNWAEQV